MAEAQRIEDALKYCINRCRRISGTKENWDVCRGLAMALNVVSLEQIRYAGLHVQPTYALDLSRDDEWGYV